MNKDEIEDLQSKLAKSQEETFTWRSNFEQLIGGILENIEERYRLLNQSFAYRAALKLFLMKSSEYSEEDVDDLIRLSIAELYLVERIKHMNTLGV